MVTPELRQLRYVVEVAEQRNFTRAAERLHVAQQALSQQVRVVEDQLGVRLFLRGNRGVELTPAGAIFVQEARRTLNAAERLVARTQAAARGEAGTIRLAYTLTSVYDTLPAIVERLSRLHPLLIVQPREVFGGEIESLLSQGRYELAVCPRTAMSPALGHQELRREPFVAAVAETHPLAGRERIAVAEMAGERFELWPRDMAPGYFDAVVAACRQAGFEPRFDEHAAGSTVWGSIAHGDGVGLVVASLTEQLPRGIRLVALEEPTATLTLDLVWHRDAVGPGTERVLEVALAVGTERGWLDHTLSSTGNPGSSHTTRSASPPGAAARTASASRRPSRKCVHPS